MQSPNIDPAPTARRAGEQLYARHPRLSLVVIGRIDEPHAPDCQGPVERWTLTEKLDHLVLGQEHAEFTTAEDAIACLRAYRRSRRKAERRA